MFGFSIGKRLAAARDTTLLPDVRRAKIDDIPYARLGNEDAAALLAGLTAIARDAAQPILVRQAALAGIAVTVEHRRNLATLDLARDLVAIAYEAGGPRENSAHLPLVREALRGARAVVGICGGEPDTGLRDRVRLIVERGMYKFDRRNMDVSHLDPELVRIAEGLRAALGAPPAKAEPEPRRGAACWLARALGRHDRQ